jgi:hypothetical protein
MREMYFTKLGDDNNTWIRLSRDIQYCYATHGDSLVIKRDKEEKQIFNYSSSPCLNLVIDLKKIEDFLNNQ